MSPGAQMTGGPQRMKANWKVVETKCLTCQGPFTFGEEVSLCTQCGGYHHSGCWDSSGGCTHPAGVVAVGRAATVIEDATAIPPPMPVGPVPPVYGAPPPPPPQPQALAPDEQFCPRCGNIVKTNAVSCRFCNTSFSYPQAPMFGQQPYGGGGYGSGGLGGMLPDLESRASAARNCGVIALVCWGLQFLIGVLIGANASSPSDAIDSLKAFMVPILLLGLTAIVLGIVAIVKGSGVKRILDRFPHDPRLRGRATAGVVMGWISTAVFAFGIIMRIVQSAGR
jgi:hypothetical protein